MGRARDQLKYLASAAQRQSQLAATLHAVAAHTAAQMRDTGDPGLAGEASAAASGVASTCAPESMGP